MIVDYVNRFITLSAEAQQALEESMVAYEYPAGTVIIQQGKVCNDVYVLAQGLARSYYLRGSNEITNWFAFENQLVTSFVSFISRKPGLDNIQLLEPSTLYGISYDKLKELIRAYPNIAHLRLLVGKYHFLDLADQN